MLAGQVGSDPDASVLIQAFAVPGKAPLLHADADGAASRAVLPKVP